MLRNLKNSNESLSVKFVILETLDTTGDTNGCTSLHSGKAFFKVEA